MFRDKEIERGCVFREKEIEREAVYLEKEAVCLERKR